jgi:hypothetical protein
MRRALAIALAALTALALAGIAGAVLRSSGVHETSAEFRAGVERYESRTCTGTDEKTYQIVNARYAGTAVSGEEGLNGPIVLHVKSVYNATDGVGYVHGKLKIRRGEDERRGWGKFWAVNKGGQLDGFVVGGVNHRYARLLGNLTANYNAASDGGFSEGTIGGGTQGNSLALLVGHRCNGAKPPRNSVKLVVKGTVEAIGGDSPVITIKPFDGGESKTCKITGDSPKTDGIDPGDHVKAECKTSDLVLTRIQEYRSKRDAVADRKADEEKKDGDEEKRGDD